MVRCESSCGSRRACTNDGSSVTPSAMHSGMSFIIDSGKSNFGCVRCEPTEGCKIKGNTENLGNVSLWYILPLLFQGACCLGCATSEPWLDVSLDPSQNQKQIQSATDNTSLTKLCTLSLGLWAVPGVRRRRAHHGVAAESSAYSENEANCKLLKNRDKSGFTAYAIQHELQDI